MPENKVDVKADTIKDFMRDAPGKIGKPGTKLLGVTASNLNWAGTVTKGKISKIKLTLTVTIKRAHFAGGKSRGKPDANNKKAMEDAEAANAEHEHNHQRLAEDICKRMCPDAEKDLIGKSAKDANDAVKKIMDEIDKKNKELDKKEGMTQVTENSDGTFTVKQVGVP